MSLTPTIDKILALETSRSCTEFWLGQEPRRPILHKGTGKQVAQKSGLNRAILGGSPFEQRRQLQYKTDWRGGLFCAVPPQNTSRTCPVAWGGCGQVPKDNRKTQAKLVCLECGLSANADSICAVNIREAGASWQEPTEGIQTLVSFCTKTPVFVKNPG